MHRESGWVGSCPSVPVDTIRTHDPVNLATVMADRNLYLSNRALQDAVVREGAAWASDEIGILGEEIGRAEWQKRGDDANRNPPVLKNFDRFGRRRDEFEFHPAWHDCMRWLKKNGVDTGAWADPRPGSHVRRAALFQLFAEIECGSLCPTTMTYGVVPIVSRVPDLAELWLPLLLSREYDERFLPAQHKRGVMMGMAVTEKQGGSDVRANTTRAEPIGGGWFRLTGHKWFVSATMCDAFLVTAQTSHGVSCFFLPRLLPDGSLNPFNLVRAKDKMGDRSNAGAEVELPGSLAYLVGEEGRGIATVLEMATYTRLDCANGSTGIMRSALSHALHHASHRQVFGKRLIDQPLMKNVLADLALEVESHCALAMRVAGAFDRQHDAQEEALCRVLTPVVKYWITKRCPAVTAETMEVLGGIGYIEEGPMARLFRQSPLNAIWEGSGNVMALDLQRALQKTPDSLRALEAELSRATGRHRAYDRFLAVLEEELSDPGTLEQRGRRLIEKVALAMQAKILLCDAPDFVGEAFCATRLGGDGGAGFGTLPKGAAFDDILKRSWPC